MLRVAILFDSFGPYHVARLAAASARMRVLGIEIAESSHEYEWNRPDVGASFERAVLFPGTSSLGRTSAEIADRLEEALSAFAPDAVALPGWSDKGSLVALRWACRNRVPAIMMSESNRYDERRLFYREAIKRAVVGLCAAGLAGGSRAATYLETLGLPSDRITVGYDVVENAHFARGADAARADAPAVRARLGLPERYFLTCCRFIEKKNLAFLIDAYATYRETAGDAAWSLVLAGDGALRGALEAQVDALGLGSAVHFPGFVQYDELPAYYGMAGAFVLPSTVEQWGLVVNEAMAAGLPVLVSNRCGSAGDLVIDGRNGFAFDPADRAALVQGMIAVAADTEMMGAESRAIVAEWGPERFANGLAEMVDKARSTPVSGSLMGRLALKLALS